MKNSEIFLEKFNEIEHYLKKISDNSYHNGFAHLVKINKKKNRIVSFYYDDLLEFAKLRNAIVHSRSRDHQVIAEPNDYAVGLISKIAETLVKEFTLEEFLNKKVIRVDLGENLEKVLSIFADYKISQIPVYEGQKYIDVISTNTIVNYFSKNRSFEVSIKELLNYKREKEVCRFISKDSTLLDVLDIFEEEYFSRDRIRIEALLITKDGTSDSKPLGIITHTDLPKINKIIGI